MLAAAILGSAILMPEVIGAPTLSEMIRRVSAPMQLARGVFALGMISAVGFQTKSHLNRHWPGSVLQCSVVAGLLVIGGVLLVDVKADRNSNLLATGDFYGALAVYSVGTHNSEGHYYLLRHGRTVHRIQYTAPDRRRLPTSYYGPDSGIRLLMLYDPRRSAPAVADRSLRVGAIGLGIGTIAAYGESGDSIRFYEINPTVTRIAINPNGYFSY